MKNINSLTANAILLAVSMVVYTIMPVLSFAPQVAEAKTYYTINASAGTGGIIDPDGLVSVESGHYKNFTITPNTGYIVSDVLVDGSSWGRLNEYKFDNVTADHTISASFKDGWKQPASYNGDKVKNPQNARTSDDHYAEFNSGDDYEVYGDFGLSIPTGAIINGIEVGIEGLRTNSPRTFNVLLSWDNGTSWSSSNNNIDLTTTENTIVLGSSVDKWGSYTWIPTDFNDGSFIVKIDSNTASGNENFKIDQLQVKVYYTLPDTVPPTITVPADVVTEATGPTTSVLLDSPIVSDNIDPSPIVTNNGLAVYPVGTTVVIWTATDHSGNSNTATQNVTINDTTPPEIDSISDITLEAIGPDGTVVNYTPPSAIDLVDGAVAVGCLPASGSIFPLGTTPVTCTATDSHGKSSSKGFNIIIKDNDAPVLTLPEGVKEEATGLDGAIVDYSASAVDLIDGPVSTTCNPPSGSTFPLGDTAVSCSATDLAGNTTNGNFNVIVQDTTPPSVPSLFLPLDNSETKTNPILSWETSIDVVSGIKDYLVGLFYSIATTDLLSGFPVSTTTTSYITTDLEDGTYYWGVKSRDNAGNESGWSELWKFIYDTTAPTKPVANPTGNDYQHDIIISLSSNDTNPDAIYYTLDGSEPATSTTKYDSENKISIGTDATLKAIACDKAGNVSDVMTEIYRIAPVIFSEVSTNIQETSFTATWSTDDPSTSRVIYDTVSHSDPLATSTPNYGYAFSTTEDIATTTNHSVIITGLSSGATYYYRTVSHGSPETVGDEISVTTVGTSTPAPSTSGGGGGGNGPPGGLLPGLTIQNETTKHSFTTLTSEEAMAQATTMAAAIGPTGFGRVEITIPPLQTPSVEVSARGTTSPKILSQAQVQPGGLVAAATAAGMVLKDISQSIFKSILVILAITILIFLISKEISRKRKKI